MQTKLPYIKHGNIYFVPIIRNHLNFCVMIQRTVRDLDLDKRDLIAVELPPSSLPSFREAVSELPHISVVIGSVEGSDIEEVMAVTPSHGIVEAIRLAIELDISIECIDKEIAPGNLINRYCIQYPNWPDDGLALEHGAKWYLNLIKTQVSHPPAHIDPIDTWREKHMADQLRRRHPFFRKILVVCDVAHANPIRRFLSNPMFHIDQQAEFNPEVLYRVMEPNLKVLLGYLDGIPKIVEKYEQERALGNAGRFDKRKVLLNIIYDLNKKATDMDFSIRHYQAFAQLLNNMLEVNGRISPEFEKVMVACQSCFNKAFAERVYRHLLSYFGQVKVRRVSRLLPPNETIHEIQGYVKDTGRIYVGRQCNPDYQKYELIPLFPDPPKPPLDDGDNGIAWPPCDCFADRMRGKAYNMAKQRKKRVKTFRFRGSLESGLDLRRTLRSYLSHDPGLFVKQRLIKNTTPPAVENEPIVWIFKMTEPFVPNYQFTCGTGGTHLGPTLILDWRYTSERKSGIQESDLLVSYEKVLGMVTFCNLTGSAEELHSIYGTKLPDRVPVYEDLTLIEYAGGWGDGLWQIEDRVNHKTPWWEVLLLGALAYAQRYVLYIVPNEFELPDRIQMIAASQGKDFRRVSYSSFTEEERQKLQVQYWLFGRWKTPEDSNDPKFHDFIIKRYGEKMKQFWS